MRPAFCRYNFKYHSVFPFNTTEVSQQIIKCGGLAPIVTMVTSEHPIMQNEALIALAVMSTTVDGANFCPFHSLSSVVNS